MAATAGGPAPALDLFISYAREDREAARALAEALGEAGFSVWWDRQLAGGQSFTDVIAERLGAARWVLVLWSSASVQSNFVRDESSRALAAGKLLPLRIEEVQPPLGFGTIHTLDLIGWSGQTDSAGWLELIEDLKRGPGGPAPQRTADRSPWARRRRPLLLALAAVLTAGGGIFGWQAWREQQALAQLQDGLSAHFARDRNLQAARNAYLSALQADPELGRAHYYLGHVYALLLLPRDAKAQFVLALQFESDLDPGQRDDARVQLAGLSADAEGPPVSRAAAPPAADAAADLERERLDAARRLEAARPGSEAVRREDADRAEAARAAAQAESARLHPASPAAPSPAAPSHAAPPPTRAPGGDGRGQIVVATAPAPQQLPRVAPSPELQRTIQASADSLFAPVAQTRLSAATSLAIAPGLTADVLPLAIDRSITALRDDPGAEAAAAGASNTLQLMLGASPATLNANRDAAMRLIAAIRALGDNPRALASQVQLLIDRAQSPKPPVAYIQIADESQRALATALASRVRASGYDVPGIENVGARAPSRSEVRVQGGSAPGWGRWLVKVVGEVGGEPAHLATLRTARPANDTFEIWLDKDLCVAPQRRVPACG